MVCGLWFMVHGLWSIVFHRTAHTEAALRNSPRMILFEGMRFTDSNGGGGRSPTPNDSNPGIFKGGKARGKGGFVPGGVSPQAFP